MVVIEIECRRVVSFGMAFTQMIEDFFFFFFENKDHILSSNKISQNRLEVYCVTVVEHHPSTLNNHH